jgi:hypothetical protein
MSAAIGLYLSVITMCIPKRTGFDGSEANGIIDGVLHKLADYLQIYNKHIQQNKINKMLFMTNF